jgi:predicted permease
MSSLMAKLERERPTDNRGWGVRVAAFRADLVRDVRAALLVLLAGSGLLLVIACVNVAGLMFAQALSREREMAMRSALGAGAWRLGRQLLCESLVLALAGSAVGLVLGRWLLRGVLGLLPAERALVGEAGLDGIVLLFTLGVALASGLGFGMVPALRATRPNLVEALKEGGPTASLSRRRRRLQDALVLTEVAVAVVLLVGAGLTVRSFHRLSSVDPGFESESALTLQVTLPSSTYPDPARRGRYFQQALGRLAALPGVEHAGAITWRPLGMGSRTDYWPLDRPRPQAGEELIANVRLVSGEVFSALGIPLLRGREFGDDDVAEASRAVIVNQTLATQLWPNRDPIGRRLAMWWWGEDGVEAEVVGVVGDVRLRALDTAPGHTLYWPQAQLPGGAGMTLVLRTSVPPAGLAPVAREAVASVDPEVPVAQVETLERVVSASLGSPRFLLVLLGAFALTAAGLAAVGLYSVLAQAVSQRQRELGVRMALGADSAAVVRLVARQAAKLTLAGLGIGLAAALALSRLLRSQLYETSVIDPLAHAIVCGLVLVIAGLATLLPAGRAVRIDPVRTLKTE